MKGSLAWAGRALACAGGRWRGLGVNLLATPVESMLRSSVFIEITLTARCKQSGITLRIMQFQGSQRTPPAVVEGHAGVSGVGWRALACAGGLWRGLAGAWRWPNPAGRSSMLNVTAEIKKCLQSITFAGGRLRSLTCGLRGPAVNLQSPEIF